MKSVEKSYLIWKWKEKKGEKDRISLQSSTKFLEILKLAAREKWKAGNNNSSWKDRKNTFQWCILCIAEATTTSTSQIKLQARKVWTFKKQSNFKVSCNF